MRNIFNLESPIFRFLTSVFDFFLLNVVALLLCLPVVTAGAAITALYRVVLSYLDHSDESLSVGRLLREWVSCLKSATLPWMGFLGAALFLVVDIRVIGYMPETVRGIMAILAILLMNVLLLAGLFYFPLLSQSPGCKFRALLRRSIQLAIGLLPRMVLLAVLWVLPWALLIFLPKIFIALTFLWLGGWLSVCALAGGKLLAPYLIPPK